MGDMAGCSYTRLLSSNPSKGRARSRSDQGVWGAQFRRFETGSSLLFAPRPDPCPDFFLVEHILFAETRVVCLLPPPSRLSFLLRLPVDLPKALNYWHRCHCIRIALYLMALVIG